MLAPYFRRVSFCSAPVRPTTGGERLMCGGPELRGVRAYRVAYDGRPYRGFQRQPSVPTVEDAILDALVALDVLEAEGETPPGYAAAGRTDAGVSAVAQTVAFEAPEWLSPAALNAELPDDVRAWASAAVPDDFHATHDAVAREYVYHLYAPREADARGSDHAGADDERAREALARVEGTHDFHNLTAASRGDTVRTVETATAERDGDYLVVTIRADGFLHEMVRRVVSLVASVARAEGESGAVGMERDGAGMERVERVLGDESLSGPEGIAPASPYPLVLVDVEYPAAVAFEVDAEAATSARAVFEALRVERATGARVAGTVVDEVDGGR